VPTSSTVGATARPPDRPTACPMSPDSVPSLWKLARLDFDPVRNRPVLLYPEGAVLLNDTGKAILELVDGRRSIREIAGILGERYQTDVTADVSEYLSHLAERELIRDG
ncbi:MAG TPA: pyrroloquinoline quinone biosynthesis peptide chaperone PqqD, partial [Gemmatimonadales bacterium]